MGYILFVAAVHHTETAVRGDLLILQNARVIPGLFWSLAISDLR